MFWFYNILFKCTYPKFILIQYLFYSWDQKLIHKFMTSKHTKNKWLCQFLKLIQIYTMVTSSRMFLQPYLNFWINHGIKTCIMTDNVNENQITPYTLWPISNIGNNEFHTIFSSSQYSSIFSSFKWSYNSEPKL